MLNLPLLPPGFQWVIETNGSDGAISLVNQEGEGVAAETIRGGDEYGPARSIFAFYFGGTT